MSSSLHPDPESQTADQVSIGNVAYEAEILDAPIADVVEAPEQREEPPAPAPDPMQKLVDLARVFASAVDDCALGNPGLAKGLGELGQAKGLGASFPPHTASASDGLRFYGGEWSPLYSLWLHWRNVARMVAAFDAWRGVAPSTVPPVVPPVEPDEAPGIVPEPPGGEVERQPRLHGIG